MLPQVILGERNLLRFLLYIVLPMHSKLHVYVSKAFYVMSVYPSFGEFMCTPGIAMFFVLYVVFCALCAVFCVCCVRCVRAVSCTVQYCVCVLCPL